MPVRPGDLTFAHVRRFVDRVVTVDDPDDRRRRAVDLRATRKIVAEPSGAATTAAVRSGALDAAFPVDGPIVAIVSGGNMGDREARRVVCEADASKTNADRTLRDGTDAVDLGEPRRLRHERERRPAADAARARRDGVRSRRVPRSAARLQPVERHDRAARTPRGDLPGRRPGADRGHQRHVGGQLPHRPQPAAPGDDVAMEVPNYMQMPGVARSLGATVRTFRCGRTAAGSRTGTRSSAP